MLLPSLVFSLIAAGVLWFALRKNPAGSTSAPGLILALLLILPLLGFAPKFSVEVTETTSPSKASLLIPYLWLAGFILFSLKGLRDLLAIQKWRRESTPTTDLALFQETLDQLKVRQKVSLHLQPQLNSPVVAGILRPTIYLPNSSANWSPETLRMALLHELGHIQRRDLWKASLAYLACLLHWFNPAVWWLRRTFLAQCEFACDAHLVQHGA
ncbi:M56 family metallopeptidase, partial [Akkermansiaceae bacterium]|nr:M56 family metallopeptidase [Akkermansiaceae bacterium]